MIQPYLIYGAYGFTGKLISRLAKEKGHHFIIGGRDAAKTEALAQELGVEFKVFGLENASTIEKVVSTTCAVLHCAGPFSKTAAPMIDACLKMKVHYLDITGEIDVFELAVSKDMEAKNRGIVLMPGVGFDVVPSDCLAAYLKKKLPDATSLEMGFKGVSKLSRGTALTMAENMHKGGMIRENGLLKEVPSAYKVREELINGKKQSFVSIPWGDVATAFYSTQITNIVIYTGVHPRQINTMRTLYSLRKIFTWGFIQNYIKKKINQTIVGPDEKLLQEGRSFLWGEVKNESGESFYANLTTIEGYRLTAITAVMAMEELLASSISAGFKTPSLAFGYDFILKVPDTSITDRT